MAHISFAKEAIDRERTRLSLPNGWYPAVGGPGVKRGAGKIKPNKETGELTAYNLLVIPIGLAFLDFTPWGKPKKHNQCTPEPHPTWDRLSPEGKEYVLGNCVGFLEDMTQLFIALLASDPASMKVLKPWPRYNEAKGATYVGDKLIEGEDAARAARRAAKEGCEKRYDQLVGANQLDYLTMDGNKPRRLYLLGENKMQDDGRSFFEYKAFRAFNDPPAEIVDLSTIVKKKGGGASSREEAPAKGKGRGSRASSLA